MIERQALVSKVGFIERWDFAVPDRGSVNLETITEEDIRRSFASAGVLPINPEGEKVLLGGHKVGKRLLWGPFSGARIGAETPEETALREAREEMGIKVELNSPTVVIKAAKKGLVKVSLSFPIILSEETKLGIPNDEISVARWYGWDDVMGLMDEANPAYNLWGGVYTWALLREWLYHYRALTTGGSFSGASVVQRMHSAVKIDAFSPGVLPYEEVKKQERASQNYQHRVLDR